MNEHDLTIGAPVHCLDDKVGSLAHLVINPDDLSTSHLIVEEGLLATRSRVLPLACVAWALPDEIGLEIGRDELRDYPEFWEETLEQPVVENGMGNQPDAWNTGGPYIHHVGPHLLTMRQKVRHGVPDDRVIVDRGTPIRGPEGQIGKLDRLIVQADRGTLSGLVIRHGFVFSEQRLVPRAAVVEIDELAIRVTAQVEDLKVLS